MSIPTEYPEGHGKSDVPIQLFAASRKAVKPSIDMNQVVGKQDILLICLDTLRYDVAVEQEAAGKTPVLK